MQIFDMQIVLGDLCDRVIQTPKGFRITTLDAIEKEETSQFSSLSFQLKKITNEKKIKIKKRRNQADINKITTLRSGERPH